MTRTKKSIYSSGVRNLYAAGQNLIAQGVRNTPANEKDRAIVTTHINIRPGNNTDLLEALGLRNLT